VIERPAPAGADDGGQDREQFPHARDERELLWVAGGEQPAVERGDQRGVRFVATSAPM
jgi:hypothetical protein